MRKLTIAALVALACLPGVARAQQGPAQGSPYVNTVPYQPAYQLLGTKGGTGQTTNATGNAYGPVMGGSYIFSVVGTFGGGSVQLQVLGADGATWQNVGTACTSACTLGVTIGASTGSSVANARAVLTGATSPSLWASLS